MPDTPLYLRVADALRPRILRGEIPPGERLPSRANLAAQFHVSEQVVRRAIDVLTAEGLLLTRSGARPTVRARRKVERLNRGWYRETRSGSPFDAEMRAQGRTGGWECSSGRDQADARVAERLGVQIGEPVLRTDYVFTADGRPATLSTSWEPLDLTGGTPVVLPEQGPYAGLGVVERMRTIGHEILNVTEVLTARTATATEGERLGIAAGGLVMVIQRTYFTAERPVETADIIVPADQYEIAYIMPVGPVGPLGPGRQVSSGEPG